MLIVREKNNIIYRTRAFSADAAILLNCILLTSDKIDSKTREKNKKTKWSF